MKKIVKIIVTIVVVAGVVAGGTVFGLKNMDKCTGGKQDSSSSTPPIQASTEETTFETLSLDVGRAMQRILDCNFTVNQNGKVRKFDMNLIEENGEIYSYANGQHVTYFQDDNGVWHMKGGTPYKEYGNEIDMVIQFRDEYWTRMEQDENGVYWLVGDGTTQKASWDGETLTIVDGDSVTTFSAIKNTQIEVPQEFEDDMTRDSMKNNILRLVDDMKEGQNFQYQSGDVTYHFNKTKNGNILMVENGKETKYYENVDGKCYVYTQNGNGWTKDVDDTNISQMIDKFADHVSEVMQTVDFKFRDGYLCGDFNGKDVKMQIKTPEKRIFQMIVDGEEITVSNWKFEDFKLPTENITDNTVESEALFKVVEGQKVWNFVALKDVVQNYLKGDNAGHKDLFAVSTRNDKDYIDDLLFMELNDSDFKLHTRVFKMNTTTNKFEEGYKVFKASEAFVNDLMQGKYKTAEELKQYLSSPTLQSPFSSAGSAVMIEYSSKTATAEQADLFGKMTDKVFDRLATKGWQTSMNGNATVVNDIQDSNILYWFKTPNSDTSAGADIGNKQGWTHYYLLEKNGKMEWVNMDVHANVDGGISPFDKVIDGTNLYNRLWLVDKPNRQEINAENKALFQNTIANVKEK